VVILSFCFPFVWLWCILACDFLATPRNRESFNPVRRIYHSCQILISAPSVEKCGCKVTVFRVHVSESTERALEQNVQLATLG
jgi:hypothetical protein